ncbi:helix-turn-helix domain-containing protein [Virgibacillus sp. Bac332]|uniref:helix-turn-helix domain-containing protein n=1 Tax=Virgibacillus sp. Bac332 TaxID=2419842 RepID=UPI000EF4D2FE|nr:hypothetical protein [Virgibacillus sp. Bac332]
MSKRSHSSEFKFEVIMSTIMKVIQRRMFKYQINNTTLSRWMETFETDGISGLKEAAVFD